MLKLVLEQVLPESVDRIIVLDTDVLVLEDLQQLWREFDSMAPDQCMALVENQSGS